MAHAPALGGGATLRSHPVSGKGDAPRPLAIDAATFAAHWARIFARPTPTTPPDDADATPPDSGPPPEPR